MAVAATNWSKKALIRQQHSNNRLQSANPASAAAAASAEALHC
jgi:hypothetical protein